MSVNNLKPTNFSSGIRFIFFTIILCSSNFICSIVSANDYFRSELTDIKEQMLNPKHWNSIKDNNQTLLTANQIALQNDQLFNKNPHMNKLSSYPSVFSNEQIYKKIISLSKKPSSNRYFANGNLVSKNQWANYLKNTNLTNLKIHPHKKVTVQFALVVKRTALRTFPTDDAVFKKPNEINLDRFQETAVFPTEVIAIMHSSKDTQWLFVSNYNYSGWVKKKDVAIGDRDEILSYANKKNFLTITGDKVYTNYNPHNKNISQIQLDMGVHIPLVNKNDIPTSIGGQNTYASYVILLPTRNDFGNLELKQALIARSQDVKIGNLAFSEKNIINQSFKFLGQRYGWGHSFNARDCTGFVGDVYKSFGILMPRNTGAQALSHQGTNIRFTNRTSNEEKLKEIRQLNPGDLIYIPGHVMMFLGLENNEPFVIHDVSGFNYYNKKGDYIKSKLNGVSVTPLIPLQSNAESSYLDEIYTLKKMRK